MPLLPTELIYQRMKSKHKSLSVLKNGECFYAVEELLAYDMLQNTGCFNGGTMLINIVNESSYKKLNVVCDNKTFSLNKDNKIEKLDIGANTKIEIRVLEKNRVLLNLLFILIDGFFDCESVVNNLVCDFSFNICETGDLQTLIIKDIEHRDDKNGYIYESVFVENDNVSNLLYSLTNTDKARKKALFFYIFIVSWLPFILGLLGYCLFAQKSISAIAASVLILLVFAIPAWKKAARVKKYYSNEYANEKLNEEYKNIKADNITNEPKDIAGKSIYKALDFLFKKKK